MAPELWDVTVEIDIDCVEQAISESRLDSLDRNEMWDAMRKLRPGLTWANFCHRWNDFQAEKRRRALH